MNPIKKHLSYYQRESIDVYYDRYFNDCEQGVGIVDESEHYNILYYTHALNKDGDTRKYIRRFMGAAEMINKYEMHGMFNDFE